MLYYCQTSRLAAFGRLPAMVSRKPVSLSLASFKKFALVATGGSAIAMMS